MGLMGWQVAPGGETYAAALEYSNAIFAGTLAYWLLSMLTSIVRGAGQAMVLAAVYLSAEVLHILLVPVLVFGLGPLRPLGITGAGIATVASFTASSIVLVWYIASERTAIKLSFPGVRLDRRLFSEILRVGAPMSLQPFLNSFALTILTGFAGTLGAAQLAGFGVAVRLEYLLYPLAFSLGAGVLAMVGTNIGAGELFTHRARSMDGDGPCSGRHWMRRTVRGRGTWHLDRHFHRRSGCSRSRRPLSSNHRPRLSVSRRGAHFGVGVPGRRTSPGHSSASRAARSWSRPAAGSPFTSPKLVSAGWPWWLPRG
jgi:MatE protein